MKKYFTLSLILFTLALTSCDFMVEGVNGNGNVKTETRQVGSFSKIKLKGSIDVILSKGPTNVKVETDENLLQHVVTEVENGWLVIKMKDNISFKTSNNLRVYVSTSDLNAIEVSGSGDVSSDHVFTADNKINLEIGGSGDIALNVHAPAVNAEISGSGDIKMAGETRDVDVHIAGSGNFNGRDLKAENVDIDIAGSGDAFVFADINLKASIAGSGGVRYRGNATVEKHVAGSGSVTKVE